MFIDPVWGVVLDKNDSQIQAQACGRNILLLQREMQEEIKAESGSVAFTSDEW